MKPRSHLYYLAIVLIATLFNGWLQTRPNDADERRWNSGSSNSGGSGGSSGGGSWGGRSGGGGGHK